MANRDGIVVKGIGGFYYVNIDGKIIEAKGKGVLKKDGFVLAVGDRVSVEFKEDTSPVIEKVYDRKNSFIRPPIANIDAMIITLAAKDPEPNFNVLDKLIIMAEKNNINIAICINKTDLASYDEILSMYREYEVIPVSGINKEGIDKLKAFIKGKTVAFAGASGVGKSTLINCLKESEIMETGAISEKTSRGRHTTRHVEIFTIDNGGMIFDTPGFSSYELMDIEPSDLAGYYPEVRRYAGGCRYDNCRHIKEPECSVRNAVREGKLNKARYLSYKNNYLELLEKKKY
ncbi:MAG: ribosome small subunit-dependent GTPase A [Clostridia bacterium]|nr:ribosome small subunit-dependent GTPase A [Clostridia bacterium]